MKISPTAIADVLLIEPDVFGDVASAATIWRTFDAIDWAQGTAANG